MEDDKTVRALLRVRETRKPIALLADDMYALFPYHFDPKWMYVVLGFYQVVDAWGKHFRHLASSSLTWLSEEFDVDEIDGSVCGRKKFKFAFQYCEEGEPWWVQIAGSESLETPVPFDPDPQLCQECGKESSTVYARWMCLNSRCPNFFEIAPDDYRLLKIRENFLALRAITKCEGNWKLQYNNPKNRASLLYSARGQWCIACGQLCVRYVYVHCQLS